MFVCTYNKRVNERVNVHDDKESADEAREENI